MKKRQDNLLKWVLGGFIICVLLMIPELLIARKISLYNLENDFTKYYAIMEIGTLTIYFIIILIKTIKFVKFRKLYNINKRTEIMNELTSEFKQVILKSSEYVPKEKFECQAKVDENGKITCKIYANYETKLDSYEDFLNYFYLNNE